MICIVLNEQQKTFVESKNSGDSILSPVAIKNNLYILPEKVLDDANHAGIRDFLVTLDKRQIQPNEFLTDEI